MKVGIITFHKVMNFGAVLQATALCRFIKEKFCDCEVIDYVPNNQVNAKRNFVIRFLGKVKRFVFKLFVKNNTVKSNRFAAFVKENMTLSSKRYMGDSDITNTPPKYDVYISGSDQIFNTTLTGDSKAFYLSFVAEGQKISYGSSFGRTEISAVEKDYIKRFLPSFDSLAFRERSGCEIVKSVIAKDSVQVVDPVFLLDKKNWQGYEKNVTMPSKYIVAYAMEYSNAMKATIDSIQKSHKIPVFLICGNEECASLGGKRIDDLGPAEFLNVISNSEMVITNSFHGTAFSMIYGKEFYCVAHSTRNARIDNLLTLTGEKEKLITDVSDSNKLSEKRIDGGVCYSKIVPYIDLSKKYIEASLL